MRREYVGCKVVQPMLIDRDVDGRRIRGGCGNRGEPRELRRAGNVRRDVGPALPAVARQLQVPVVGSRPDDVGIAWTLGDRDDRAVKLGARVVDRNRPAAGTLLVLVIGSEIGTDDVPRRATVAG